MSQKRVFVLLLCLSLSVLYGVAAVAQKTVSGKVTDSRGGALPGVGVLIKGNPSIGTVTDESGTYSLEAPSGSTLVFSSIGFKTVSIALGTQSVINVILQEDIKLLEDVVVIGYGVQKKVNLSGSVSSVEIDKLSRTRPITNLSAGLAGLAPGLYVRASNNDPGSSATLLIRGQGTLNNSSPLIIIDGVEGDISRLSPHDVASISVLKDAASSAIYGSRAANGVILITTKQGKEGKVTVTYDGYYALQSVGRLMPIVSNSVRYMELVNEAANNSKLAPVYSEENIQLWRDHEGEDPVLWPNTDWGKALFRSAGVMNHDISASGGSDKLRSFLSFNYAGTPGIIVNTGYRRYSIRSNNSLSVTSRLKLGMNLSGTLTDKERGSSNLSNMFVNSILCVPTVVVKSPDGRYGGTNNPEDNPVATSPLRYMNSVKGEDKAQTFNGRLWFDFSPVDGLNVNGSYTYFFYTKKQTTIPVPIDTWNFQTNQILSLGSSGQSFVKNQEDRAFRNFMDMTATYEKRILPDFYFKVMIGGSQEQFAAENFYGQKMDLIDPELTQIDAAT